MTKGVSRRFLSLFLVILLLVSTMAVMGGFGVSSAEVEAVEVFEDSSTGTPIIDEAEERTVSQALVTTPETTAATDVYEFSYETPGAAFTDNADSNYQTAELSTDAIEATQAVTVPSETVAQKAEIAELAAESEAAETILSDYAIRGTFTDWESTDAVAFVQGSSTVIEAVYTVEPGEYRFKVYNMTTATWYGNSGTIDDACSNWGFRTGQDSCNFNATGGIYKFTVDVADTSRLDVTVERIGDIEEKTGVYINGVFYEAKVGDIVTFTEYLKADELFENIQGSVSYDDTKLSFVRKNQHSTLTEREIACPELDGVFYPDVEGIVTFNAAKVQGYDFRNGAVLITLDFEVVAEGESTLELVIQEMAIKGEDGRSYFKNGQAEVIQGITLSEDVKVSETGATDPVENVNSGFRYIVTADTTAQITYYTGTETDLVIPNVLDGYTVTSLADYTFYNYETLNSVVLPETMTTIGAYAFYYCDALKTVTIPQSVTEIGKKAFAQDTAITDVYYGSTEAAWADVNIAQENECLTNATIHYTDNVPTDPATPDEPSTEPEKVSYTVEFLDYDGKSIDVQNVEEGQAAIAPTAPSRSGYTFVGWDTDFSNVTSNLTVTAKYEKISTPPATPKTGTIRITVTGGTGFTISIDGGTSRPQGASYHNSQIPVGVNVTVTAGDTSSAEFCGWINPISGTVVSTDPTYTFVTSGNDSINAMYSIVIEGMQMVTFKNTKSDTYGRILDSQYYAADDSITFPAAPTQVGFDFAGWSMTEEEIKAAIANGEDVNVVANWTRQIVPVQVTVNGGTGTGSYNANSAVTVVANEAPEGEKFAYWTDAKGNIKSYSQTYKFFPSTDTTVTAVFVAEDTEVEYEILVGIDSIDTTTVAEKNVFYYSWYCPEEYTFVKAGILAVNKDNYNAETFVVGTEDTNVYDRSPSGTIESVGSTFWTKSKVTSGQTWLAVAYVQYRDASNQIVTVYSDIVEATKD